MTSLTSDRAMRHRRMARGMALAFGLTALVFVAADARAGSRADFGGETAMRIAVLGSPTFLVDTDVLASQRAKGAEATSTPDGSSTVAVILWDDAWSDLQRRARAGSVNVAGTNANSSLAGSSGN